MPEYRRLFVVTIMLVLTFSLAGCGYHCCTVGDGPDVAWPAAVEKVKKQDPAQEPVPKEQPVKEAQPAPKEPVEPLTPEEPVTEQPPVEPMEPKPEQPVEPIEPVEPVEPVEPKEPVEPVEPIEPIEPIEPVEPVVPVVPKKAQLESNIQGESMAMMGIEHPLTGVISNKGDGAAATFTVKITLPQGLEFAGKPGEQIYTKEFKALDPGIDRKKQFKVVGNKLGQYSIIAEIISDGKTVYSSNFALEIKGKPGLKISLDGPKKEHMEKQFDYKITIENTGQVDLTGITIQNKLPQGIIYISSTPEGTYKEEKSIVTWKASNLAVGANKTFTLKVTAIEKREITNYARARDSQKLAMAQASLKTEIGGEIGLQVQHFDTTDPIEVGEKTTYVIEVSNQGYKDATNIRVVDTIPVEGSFIEASVEGTDIPLSSKVEGNKVVFDTVDFLKPGKKIIFRVTIKVNEAGDLLNNVEIQSDEFGKPITKQEGSKAFAKSQE